MTIFVILSLIHLPFGQRYFRRPIQLSVNKELSSIFFQLIKNTFINPNISRKRYFHSPIRFLVNEKLCHQSSFPLDKSFFHQSKIYLNKVVFIYLMKNLRNKTQYLKFKHFELR